MVLLCGDLNSHPKDVGCRLLKEWTGLQDAYLETRDFKVRACLPRTWASRCLLPHAGMDASAPRALKKGVQ